MFPAPAQVYDRAIAHRASDIKSLNFKRIPPQLRLSVRYPKFIVEIQNHVRYRLRTRLSNTEI